MQIQSSNHVSVTSLFGMVDEGRCEEAVAGTAGGAYSSTPCSLKRLISASSPKGPLTFWSITSSFFPRCCNFWGEAQPVPIVRKYLRALESMKMGDDNPVSGTYRVQNLHQALLCLQPAQRKALLNRAVTNHINTEVQHRHGNSLELAQTQ